MPGLDRRPFRPSPPSVASPPSISTFRQLLRPALDKESFILADWSSIVKERLFEASRLADDLEAALFPAGNDALLISTSEPAEATQPPPGAVTTPHYPKPVLEVPINAKLVDIIREMIPGSVYSSRIVNEAKFGFGRSEDSGISLREVCVEDGVTYGTIDSTRREMEWRKRPRLQASGAAQSSEQAPPSTTGPAGTPLLSLDDERDAKDSADAGVGTASRTTSRVSASDPARRAAKRFKSELGGSTGSRRESDQFGNYKPDLFGYAVSSPPPPPPPLAAAAASVATSSSRLRPHPSEAASASLPWSGETGLPLPLSPQTRPSSTPPGVDDHPSKLSVPPKRDRHHSDHPHIPNPPSAAARFRLSDPVDVQSEFHSAPKSPAVGTANAAKSQQPDPAAAAGPAPPDASSSKIVSARSSVSVNTKARLSDMKRGKTCLTWMTGEVKPSPGDVKAGVSKEFIYAIKAFQLCGCWIGMVFVANRYARCVVLSDGVIAFESRDVASRNKPTRFGKDFLDGLEYEHLPHVIFSASSQGMPGAALSAQMPGSDVVPSAEALPPTFAEAQVQAQTPLGPQGPLDSLKVYWDTVHHAANLVANLHPFRPLERIAHPKDAPATNNAWTWLKSVASLDTNPLSIPPALEPPAIPVDLKSDLDPIAALVPATSTTSRPRLQEQLDWLHTRASGSAGPVQPLSSPDAATAAVPNATPEDGRVDSARLTTVSEPHEPQLRSAGADESRDKQWTQEVEQSVDDPDYLQHHRRRRDDEEDDPDRGGSRAHGSHMGLGGVLGAIGASGAGDARGSGWTTEGGSHSTSQQQQQGRHRVAGAAAGRKQTATRDSRGGWEKSACDECNPPERGSGNKYNDTSMITMDETHGGYSVVYPAHELQHSLPAAEDADTGSESGPSFSDLDFVSLTDDDSDDDEARAVSREYKWTNRGIQALYEAGLVVVLVSPLMMDRLIGL